jgi:hypothetical protein
MTINEEVLKNMDEAAETAKTELDKLPPESVKIVAKWWKDNYLKSGHKRLAKLLLSY